MHLDTSSQPAEAGDGGRAQRPQLLYFRPPTSGPCRRIDGFLAQVLQAGQNHDTFDVIHVDPEQRPDLVARLQVESIPTMVVLDGGQIRGRLAGPWGSRPIADLLAPWLR